MPFDFTALLNDWGINFKMIFIGAGVTLVILTLSLREFFYWFLRTHAVVKKQTEILDRLSKIENLLKKETLEPEAKKFTLSPVASTAASTPSSQSVSNVESEPLIKKLH